MTRFMLIPLAAAAIPATALAQAASEAPPPALTPPPATTTSAALAPAFEAGAEVRDRNGVLLGEIASVAPAADGKVMVVVAIDGKLVGVPETSLTLSSGGGAVSRQTKAEVLAAAGASR